MNSRIVGLNSATPALRSAKKTPISRPARDSTLLIPPSGGYCSRDLRRTVSSSPADRRISRVRRFQCPARGWIAVPECRSTTSG